MMMIIPGESTYKRRMMIPMYATQLFFDQAVFPEPNLVVVHISQLW